MSNGLAAGFGFAGSLLGTVMGNRMDMSNQRKMYDYRIKSGLAHGMTPYEMFTGGAAGAGGGTTGTGQTLGNSASQLAQQTMQLGQQQQENEKNRENEIAKAEIQAETAKEVASIQSGATRYSSDQSAQASRYQADTNKQIADNKLKLDRERFQYIDLPQAAAQLDLTKAQLSKTINEVATSHKDFVLYMKKLSMGLDNMVAEYLQGNYGFDVTKPETYPGSEKRRKELLGFLLAIQSGTLKNVEGLKELISQGAESTLGWAKSFINNSFTLGNKPWKQRMVQPGPPNSW